MRTDRRRFPLFVAWTLAAFVLIAGVGLTLLNYRLLRERSDIHALLRPHRVDINLAMIADQRQLTPVEVQQIRGAYNFPERTDLSRISWNLVNRPTPYLGGMPQPGYQAGVHFNAQQFRNRDDLKMPKPAGVFRIFVTGGSFAFSIGAPSDDQTICALLESKLNRDHGSPERKFEVWCCAVPSWCSTHERIAIENRIVPLDPDLTIMLTGANECHWGYLGANALDLRTYTDDEFFALINETLKIDGLAPYPSDPPAIAKEKIDPDLVAQRFAYNVGLAAGAMATVKKPVLVALQPYLWEKAKKLTDVERKWITDAEGAPKIAYMDACYAAMEKAMTTLAAGGNDDPANLKYASLTDAFADRSDPIFFDHYHIADKGNAIVADRLEKVLEEQKLLPPGK